MIRRHTRARMNPKPPTPTNRPTPPKDPKHDEDERRKLVRRQINYGRQRGVPWGLSESGYNTIDLHMNYQYRAFGVPGWGSSAVSPRTSWSRRMPVPWR